MATQQQLEAWFAAVDKDGSGAINVAELQQCLAQSGLNFSMKLVSSLIRMYDTDRTATYSKSEFFQLYGFLQRVQTTFAQFDRDRSGVLDLEEMYQALIALGYTLDKQPGGAYYTLCQSYDFDRSGKFKFDSPAPRSSRSSAQSSFWSGSARAAIQA